MVIPNISPKTQNRIPTNSRVWPSVPRKRTWERSGSFRLASPPAVSAADWASAAVALNNVRAALTAPTFTNRLRSEPLPASQVRISDPPSRILIQGNFLSIHRLPAHLLALEVLRQGAESMAYRNFLQAATPRLDRSSSLNCRQRTLPGVKAGKDTHDPNTGCHKAYFYNMLGADGQTVLHLGW